MPFPNNLKFPRSNVYIGGGGKLQIKHSAHIVN